MVRPIDLQDNLSKAPLASRTQQIQQITPEMAHRQVTRELAEQQLVDQGRPLPSEEADRVELHPDDEKDQPRRQNSSRQAEDEVEEERDAAVDSEGDSSHIDIVA